MDNRIGSINLPNFLAFPIKAEAQQNHGELV